ncbi:MAG: tyrosine--tRNA ligase [Candidatus Puniceispirillales bacterium WSBS_2018_MAG_OTU23]
MKLNSKFLTTITEREYIHQATNLAGLDAAMNEACLPAYIGFDCTADSLHVGSLVQIMMLRILQQHGHKPIVLMGGGTTKIGDPSGKDTQRPLLSDLDIERNKNGILKVFKKYLKFGDAPTDAVMVDNAEWLDKLEYVSFLRDYGVHFSINRMLSMDSVKQRLDREQPMSLLEFNYSILQAYDFMELRRRYGCVLQMGGSDQWGNIITGVDLTRRVDRQEVFGLTSPLITTASGEKMGKSAQGAIWLNKDKLPVWDFWQFWRNTEDGDVGLFLKLFTELSLDEIDAVMKGDINKAKIILATAVTSLCHSKDEAAEAAETAANAFSGGGNTEGLPQVDCPTGDMSFIDALKTAGLASSNGEARRLIRGGGARLNDAQINDENHQICVDDFGDEGRAKLSSGKKRHIILKLSS